MARPSRTIAAPSILAANFGALQSEIADVERSGATWLHIDVMDGVFVPPITFGDNLVKVARTTSKLFLDVHLMIVEPDKHLAAFKNAGADRIIVHIEACPHAYRTLSAIRELGIYNGIALNPGTPVSAVESVLEVADLVLVMSVNPGWGGQKFISSSLSKIEQLRNIIDRSKLSTLIEVDGGIDAKTAAQCKKAGVDVFVSGSYIFGSKERGLAIGSLQI